MPAVLLSCVTVSQLPGSTRGAGFGSLQAQSRPRRALVRQCFCGANCFNFDSWLRLPSKRQTPISSRYFK